MNRLILLAALVAACLLLAPREFAHSLVRGSGWGIGREAAHAMFRGLR